MFKHSRLLPVCIILTIFSFYKSISAEVTPEILLGARGFISLNIEDASTGDRQAVSDVSDSSVLLGFRQKLYSNYRGQFVLGFQLPDRDSDLDSPFFHQVFFKIEDRPNILKLGRTRLRTTLIEFPTLHDDDAIHFTDITNPFITGKASEENQFGELLQFSHIFQQRYWIDLYGAHAKEDTLIAGDGKEDLRFNNIGIIFQYKVPKTQRWNRELLNQIGIGFNTFLTDRPEHSGFSESLKNILFSTILNIYPDPVHFWDARHQTIYNPGFSEINEINDFSSMAKAKAISLFTSVRYLYRKLERPTFQGALSYSYKDFPDMSESTNQHQLVAGGFYRIGANFDIGLQFQYLMPERKVMVSSWRCSQKSKFIKLTVSPIAP